MFRKILFLVLLLVEISILTSCGQSNNERFQQSKVKTQVLANDDFLLGSLPEDQLIASLSLGRDLLIPYATYTLVSFVNGPGHVEERAVMQELRIFDGNYYQAVENDSWMNLDNKEIYNRKSFFDLHDQASCTAYWVPVKPKNIETPKNGYWQIKKEDKYLLSRPWYSKPKDTSESMILDGVDASFFAQVLILKCKDVPSNKLSVGHLKKVFGKSAQLTVEH